MVKPERQPSVAIAGGGPAGAVAALVLARRGVPVVVLEPNAERRDKVGETLPPSLRPLLEHLGLDQAMEQDGHLRSHGNRSFWGSYEASESPFLANPYGSGWHVDRRRLEERLEAAARRAGAQWRRLRVDRVRAQGQRWRLELSGPPERGQSRPTESLEVDFLADATGRPCRIARRLGARRVSYDRLMGVHTTLVSETPCAEAYTLVEAVAGGWWYSANLAGGGLAVCLFSDLDLLDRPLLRGDGRGWWSRLRLTQATRQRVEAHGYRLRRGPRVLPAESSRLDQLTGERWLALGDAGAAYDPLSSHGVASAMGSGFYGGHAIADLLAGRSDADVAYRSLMQQAYGGYLELLAQHYAQEQRWSDAPFWRRRHREAFVRVA